MPSAAPRPRQPAGQERSQALGEEGRRRRLAGHAPELVVARDPEDAAARGGRREGAEDHVLADPPGQHDEQEEPEAGERRRPADAAAGAPAVAPALGPHQPPALDQEGEGEGHAEQEAVVAREGRQPDDQPAEHVGPSVAPQAAGAGPQGERAEEHEEREVVRLGQEGEERPGRDGQHAGGGGPEAPEPRVHAHPVDDRRHRRADQPEGQAVGQRGRPEEEDEGDLDDRGQGHPVGVRGDRQPGVGRQASADVHEVPDVVDGEALAGGQRVGHVDVVERVGVGGVREEHRGQGTRRERGQEERQRDHHGGAV